MAANITEFLTNANDEDLKAVLEFLASKDDNYVKDVNNSLSAENQKKIRDKLKAELSEKKSEFTADLILGLGPLSFTYNEQKNFTTESYVSSVNYNNSSFGDMLINKRIKDTLDNFNNNFKQKYDAFKENCKVDDKNEQYNKERFYHLLRTQQINNNYFINNLVNLPASEVSFNILNELLDNTTNPKEFLQNYDYLLSSLTKNRKFSKFNDNKTNLTENEDKKIAMIKLLLDKGGFGIVKDQSSFDYLFTLIKDNKLNIDSIISSSSKEEIINFSNYLAKANYDNEEKSKMANELLTKILENNHTNTEIKVNIIINLLYNRKNTHIDEMIINLINKDALINGLGNNIGLLANFMIGKNDLINLIKSDKNINIQKELLIYLSANASNNNLNLFEQLLKNTKLTGKDFSTSLANLCDDKWRKKKNYNAEYVYDNNKRIDLIKNLIKLNIEVPKNIDNDDVINILISSKNDQELLKIAYKNQAFLNKFITENTDKFKTKESYEALKSNIENNSIAIEKSDLLAAVLKSKSIVDDKRDELVKLLLEKGANLNNISDNKIFEKMLTLVPHDKMSSIIGNVKNDKINIVVVHAITHFKSDFQPGLLKLTNSSTTARKALIDAVFARDIEELVDLIENPTNYGLAKEQITKSDYDLTSKNLLKYLYAKNKDSEHITKIALALKKYFTHDEWLNYLIELKNDNLMRDMKQSWGNKKYYDFIDAIGVSKDNFIDTDQDKLFDLLNNFDEKNPNKSEKLFLDFYCHTFLLLNEAGIENMKKYIKEKIPGDNNNSLNKSLKTFDKVYFKLFKWNN